MRSLPRTRAIQALRARHQARLGGTKEKDYAHNSLLNRLKFGFLAGILGLLLGGLFDLATSLLRTLAQPASDAQFVWFLAYIFASLGVITGLVFGSRAGELFAQVFAAKDQGNSNASSQLIRLVAKTLLGAALVWGIFMVFLM